jgi:hypothetical protein
VSRFVSLTVPLLFLGGSVTAMVLWPIPAVIDWRIVAFVVVLSASVMAVETLPLIDGWCCSLTMRETWQRDGNVPDRPFRRLPSR